MKTAVSVVVPAYNSDATVEAFLLALRAQTFDDYELILVNSSPGDGTAAAVARIFPEATYVESAARLLPHEARNRGVEEASGELLAFTDPDCRARMDWLERLVATHRAGHDVATGAMDVPAGVGWFERGVHLCKFWWALPDRATGPAWVAPSANASYSRSSWDAAGPFPGGFSGDAQLSWNATSAGARPWFVPDAVVEHRHVGTFGRLWRERLVRGREFGAMRARRERWSRVRIAATVLASPLLPPLVLARAGRAARRSGWSRTFATTLPVQLVGHVAWSAGEARGLVDVLRSPAPT